jgi:cell division protein FtsB
VTYNSNHNLKLPTANCQLSTSTCQVEALQGLLKEQQACEHQLRAALSAERTERQELRMRIAQLEAHIEKLEEDRRRLQKEAATGRARGR